MSATYGAGTAWSYAGTPAPFQLGDGVTLGDQRLLGADVAFRYGAGTAWTYGGQP